MAAVIEVSRRQTEVDLDALRDLYAELHEHQVAGAPTLAGIAARASADAWTLRREHYRTWLKAPGSFLARALVDGGLVGFAVVTVADGYDGWSSGEPIGEIHDLIVKRSQRGQGVGTALVRRVEDELRAAGAAAYRLDIIAGNDSARSVYERLGLEVTATTMLKQL